MEDQELIYCEECQYRFKSNRSPTGYSCEVWGFGDFACYVPPDGFCHKAKPKTYKIEKSNFERRN